MLVLLVHMFYREMGLLFFSLRHIYSTSLTSLACSVSMHLTQEQTYALVFSLDSSLYVMYNGYVHVLNLFTETEH